MKVALCLQGQTRNWKPAVNYFNNIIKQYNADVFGHTWWDSDMIGETYKVSPDAANPNFKIESDLITQLKATYHFKKFKNEIQIDFTPTRKYAMSIVRPPEDHDQMLFAMKSRYYSLKSTLNLAKEYEKETGIEYDVICIARYDLRIHTFPQLILVHPHKFYVEDYMHSGRKYILNDNMWIFGKKHRFVFNHLYDDFDKTYNDMMAKNLTPEQAQVIAGTELEKVAVVNGEEFMAFYLLFNNVLNDVIQTKELHVQVIP